MIFERFKPRFIKQSKPLADLLSDPIDYSPQD